MTDEELVDAVAERIMGWHMVRVAGREYWAHQDGSLGLLCEQFWPIGRDAHMDMVLAKWTDRTTRLYGDRAGWTACVSPATGGPDRMAVSDGLTMESLRRALLLAMIGGEGL